MSILVCIYNRVQICIFLLISNLCHTCNTPIVLYPSDHAWSFVPLIVMFALKLHYTLCHESTGLFSRLNTNINIPPR